MRTKKEIIEELNQVNVKYTKISMFIAQEYGEYNQTNDNAILHKINPMIQEAEALFEKIKLLDIELKEVNE